MLKFKPFFVVLLIIIVSNLPCFAQNFEGTNLSNTPPFYTRDSLGYVFEGVENYFISFNTDPEVIRALVPEPLNPVSDGKMTFAFVKSRLTYPFKLNYYIAYFLIPVSYGKTIGGYWPVLYENKVEPIISGREIGGYNKVGAEFQIEEKDNEISIAVIQMDTLIIKASFVLGESFSPPEQPKSFPLIGLKYIPSIAKDSPPDVKQLTILTPNNRKTTLMRSGTAKLEFYSSRFNPLDKIPILKIDKAGYFKHSFSLRYGKILYDYLKNE